MRFYYFFILISFVACKSDSRNADGTQKIDLEDLHAEVLAIHDEVMPKMSVLTNLQSRMSDQLKSIKSEQPIDMDKLKIANQVLGNLNRAESAMWDWMDGFSAFDTIPVTEKEVFLMNEKASAEDMKSLILTSIQTAEKYLEENAIIIENDESI